MISDKAKAAILDKCCQKVDCLARGEVIDLEGAPDLPQRSSPVSETLDREEKYLLKHFHAACGLMSGDIQGSFHRIREAFEHAQTQQQPSIWRWRRMDESNWVYQERPPNFINPSHFVVEQFYSAVSDTSTDRGADASTIDPGSEHPDNYRKAFARPGSSPDRRGEP
jgi:hypothetical protein